MLGWHKTGSNVGVRGVRNQKINQLVPPKPIFERPCRVIWYILKKDMRYKNEGWTRGVHQEKRGLENLLIFGQTRWDKG